VNRGCAPLPTHTFTKENFPFYFCAPRIEEKIKKKIKKIRNDASTLCDYKRNERQNKPKQRNLVGLCIDVCLQLGKLTIQPNTASCTFCLFSLSLSLSLSLYIYIYIYILSTHLRVRVFERKD
jgi:hypothetical protein